VRRSEGRSAKGCRFQSGRGSCIGVGGGGRAFSFVCEGGLWGRGFGRRSGGWGRYRGVGGGGHQA